MLMIVCVLSDLTWLLTTPPWWREKVMVYYYYYYYYYYLFITYKTSLNLDKFVLTTPQARNITLIIMFLFLLYCSTHMWRNVIGLIWEVDAVTAHLCHDVLSEYDHLVCAVLKAARVAHELGAGDFLNQLWHEMSRQRRSARPKGGNKTGLANQSQIWTLEKYF